MLLMSGFDFHFLQKLRPCNSKALSDFNSFEATLNALFLGVYQNVYLSFLITYIPSNSSKNFDQPMFFNSYFCGPNFCPRTSDFL